MGVNFPSRPGFYWAKWKISDDDTPKEHDATPCLLWDVVEVFDRADDGFTDYYVYIPGVPTPQPAENFAWAACDPLPAPPNVELELRTNGERERANYLRWKMMTPEQRIADWETRRKNR